MPSKIASLLLCAALLASCANQPPQYIEVQPTCTAPPQPALPQIEGDELEALSDDVYWRLENRERRLVDWALELKAMVDELCEAPDG